MHRYTPQNLPPVGAYPSQSAPAAQLGMLAPSPSNSYGVQPQTVTPGRTIVPDFISYQLALQLILAAAPTTLLPPIYELPDPGSRQELDLFLAFCVELITQPMKIRSEAVAGVFNDQTITIALTVFRCPLGLGGTMINFGRLIGRMLSCFRSWRACWIPDAEYDGSGQLSLARLKARAQQNLSHTSPADAEWIGVLLTVLGDTPKLWEPEDLELPAPAPSALVDDNGMAVDPQFDPQSMQDNAGSLNASRMAQPEVPSSIARGFVHGGFNPTHSLPYPAVANPMYHRRLGSTHSLPNLPFEPSAVGGSRGFRPNAPQSHITTRGQHSTAPTITSPLASTKATAGGNFREGEGLRSAPTTLQDAIALQRAKAAFVCAHTSELRTRTAELDVHCKLTMSRVACFFRSMHSVLACEFHQVQFPPEHLKAMLLMPEALGGLAATPYLVWKQDLEF